MPPTRVSTLVVPGSAGLIDNEREAMRVAHEIGFPVLVKANVGGSGAGIRHLEGADGTKRVYLTPVIDGTDVIGSLICICPKTGAL
mgnify:CR=1 FL=1